MTTALTALTALVLHETHPFNFSLQVWDVHSLQEIATLSGVILSIMVSWLNMKLFRNFSLIIGHVGIVYSLTVLKAPGKMRLFSASYDKTIRVSVWSIESWYHCTTSQSLCIDKGISTNQRQGEGMLLQHSKYTGDKMPSEPFCPLSQLHALSPPPAGHYTQGIDL